MWDIIIPILTFIAGAAAGFFGGVIYLRSQVEKMRNNPELLQKMAKQMGYNMNKQQLNRAQQMLKQRKPRK